MKAKLKPQQIRAEERFSKSKGGIVLYHKPGTGKTLSAINIINKSNRPTEFITPASLTSNIKKELKKHLGSKVPKNIRIRSYEKFLRNPNIAQGSIVVLDEAHKIRNPSSQIAQALGKVKHKAHKFLPMTGSAIYDKPSDLAPLVSLVTKGSKMPKDNRAFDSKYVGKKLTRPGIIGRLRGVKSTSSKVITNERKLSKMLKGKVDYHEVPDSGDFPSMTEKTHKVPMSKTQHKYYRYAFKKLPWVTRYKIKKNMPVSKKEVKNLNSFMGMARQVSITPASYTSKTESPLHAAQMSPKIQSAVGRIKSSLAKNKRHKAIVYSNYLGSGVHPVSALLKKNKIPHGVFTGASTPKQKKSMLSQYNSGRLKVLAISSSGTEGLDTKGTRAVHSMEPHWNLEKIRQVKARARRFKSHAHLPKEQRKVTVHHYHATLPKTHLVGRIFRKITGANKHKMMDEYMHNRATAKDRLNKKVVSIIKGVNKPR